MIGGLRTKALALAARYLRAFALRLVVERRKGPHRPFTPLSERDDAAPGTSIDDEPALPPPCSSRPRWLTIRTRVVATSDLGLKNHPTTGRRAMPSQSPAEYWTMSETTSPVGPDHSDPSGRNWRTARTLNTPAARSYVEWTLLVHDRDYALSRARLWREAATASAPGDSPPGVAVSLFRDAVISFVSCFDKQVPVHLDPAHVFAALDGAVEYFEWLRDMRDSWVTHRSGPLRLCVPAIVIDEQTGDVEGVGHLRHRYLGPKPKAADDLVRVMEAALEHSRVEQRRRERRLRDDLEKLNRHERLNLARANTTIPGSSQIRMGRSKFQNIKRASQRTRRA